MDFFPSSFYKSDWQIFGIFLTNFVRKIFFSTNKLVFVLIWRVSRMVEGGTEISFNLDQKNVKRKSYKQDRRRLKSVLNSDNTRCYTTWTFSWDWEDRFLNQSEDSNCQNCIVLSVFWFTYCVCRLSAQVIGGSGLSTPGYPVICPLFCIEFTAHTRFRQK